MNNNQKLNPEQLLTELKHFHGTAGYFRYSPSLFPKFLLTDGVHHLCERAACYWLMDVIASYQGHPKVKKNRELQGLQFWNLQVKDSTGTVKCEWDKGKTVIKQEIPFTDFVLNAIDIWVAPYYPNPYEADKHWVAMLKSEY